MRVSFKRLVVLVLTGAAFTTVHSQNAVIRPADPDLTKQPTLYVVAYAHLDTQWRWQYPQVINEFLPKTMHENFALFEKYPHYIFNFSGANRYRLMKEYWPSDFERLKGYVAAGRWFPAGSSMEESDVNSPSAESIIRQILYGNKFFQREFGKTSAEYMLPDCFGFPASLPSILAHMGIKGFSTQKLTWKSAVRLGGPNSIEETPDGIPFNVGFWQGPDGRGVIAAFNPGSYGGQIREDISKSPVITDPNARNNPVDWPRRVERNGKVSGVFTDYHYYGTGDTGGSPREDSVRMVEAIVSRNLSFVPTVPNTPPPTTVGDGPLNVISSTAEQMFLNIRPEQIAGLPRYAGDLLLTDHSAGSISSQTYQKRWNRKNELLADAAEKASIGAMWLGTRSYPQERLNHAWTLVMGGQFHDILPGTATPEAFQFSWNDDVIAMNQFAEVVTDSTAGIATGLNTQTKGVPIVVYNPLNVDREDVVEATPVFPDRQPRALQVVAADGRPVPTQVLEDKDGLRRILFLARVPSVGYTVYDVQPVASQATESSLRVTESSLENARYKIVLNGDGDVASIFDKKLNKELLQSPIRLAIKSDTPRQWPAWNIDWSEQQKPPRTYVSAPAQIRITESGPVRVAVEVIREAEGSKFVQTVRLSAGDAGNRVEFGNVIDWKSSNANLKATFPLTATNWNATYNWDIGTIQRGTNDERKYEVPSHQWFDLTDRSGSFGVTILSDCKYASDKPDDSTLRLTLLRTPGIGPRAGYGDQGTQDWGHHEFVYGLASHAGDWRIEQTDWQAQRLNQPLLAFQSSSHAGVLGRNFSILKVNNSRVRVLALKKAEESDEVIVRIVELNGEAASNVRLKFAGPVISAREVNGQELPLGPASVINGQLVTNLGHYQPRTFAVRLASPPFKLGRNKSLPLLFEPELAIATKDGEKTSAGFDGKGAALPSEMLPGEIAYGSIKFELRPGPNALVPSGQRIILPQGSRRVYVLAASADDDQRVDFKVGSMAVHVNIQSWGGFIGQWDTRQWKSKEVPIPSRPVPPDTPPDIAAQLQQRTRTRTDKYGEVVGIAPGFIKRAPLAWFASHHHTAEGKNEAYSYSYLFAYELEIPLNEQFLTLPVNNKIRILAMTASNEHDGVTPAHPLYDTL
ncbi:MAG TPA: glycoside hydrolase family 38 C-terminal domain-containing protein, partial [Pyrinomonadaceae bacterium]